MLNSLFLAIRFLILIFSGYKHVALENVALRHQLAVFKREKKRPRLRNRDRWFWIALKKLWKDWRTALEFVRPETVTGWQSKRFKRYWWRLSPYRAKTQIGQKPVPLRFCFRTPSVKSRSVQNSISLKRWPKIAWFWGDRIR